MTKSLWDFSVAPAGAWYRISVEPTVAPWAIFFRRSATFHIGGVKRERSAAVSRRPAAARTTSSLGWFIPRAIHFTASRKRQRTGALQDASRGSRVAGQRFASWTAPALWRFSPNAKYFAQRQSPRLRLRPDATGARLECARPRAQQRGRTSRRRTWRRRLAVWTLLWPGTATLRKPLRVVRVPSKFAPACLWTAVASAARHRFRTHGNLPRQVTSPSARKRRRRSRSADALQSDARLSFPGCSG